ncbi:uncharacterized protein N7518_007877 [Penicillium psychrosexuale]|uniref:uncharacterized protein n=1 Tax=Penicillium psychrosexuale TaxID=1002107 RepID=UPI0025450281|nr:uncharacterized protein N7518_007877 [Penicillium psychrosexuale]KAJ5790866.1 hypothetical protein N7518_007877 [Penicillium psychrosexuale]
MDVDSPNLNPRKRLSGLLLPGSSPTKAQDPRLAGAVRQSVDSQSSTAQQAHLNLPATPALIQKSPAKSLPQVSPLSIPNSAAGPTSIESPSAPIRQGALSISDLVNSLIKVNKCEEEKERLQNEIGSITKNLQRAKQSQQFPSVIALFQQQLDAAKNELAIHVKSIMQHRLLSNQAQDNFHSTLSQYKPQPQLEKIPERIGNLESTIKEMREGLGPTSSGDNPMKGNAEFDRVQTDMRSQGQDIDELKRKLDKVQHSLENPNGLDEVMGYMNRIANSVSHQMKRNGQFTNKISELEDEVKAADKKFDDKISTVEKMVDTVEEELRNSNQKLETNISDLGGKLKTANEHAEGKLRDIESNLRSLNNKRHDLNNSASTQISQIETDLETQRQETTAQITAQEDLLASLRTQQQNLDNGGGLSSEAPPTPHSGVLTRMVSLERRVQEYTTLLNKIKDLHHEVDVARLDELSALRRNQESSQESMETKQDDTLRKVQDLTATSKEMTTNQNTLAAGLHQLRTSLSGSLQRLQNHLQNDIKNGLDGFETRLTPVSDLPRAVTKCESRIESLSRGIRSLETRWSNITTGDLVNSMAHAMQQMYPSVDKLSQQLTAYQTEIDGRISALQRDTETFKADTNRFKADTENAQACAARSQAAHVSSEQLQTLTQLPTLLQEVKGLSDKIAPIEKEIKEHSDEFQRNLHQWSDLSNRISAQDDAIGGMDQTASEQSAQFDNINESIRKIDPFIGRIDAHFSTLESVQKAVAELTKAAEERDATTQNGLGNISMRLESLEGRNKTEDEVLNELRKQLKDLEALSTAEKADLGALRTKLKELEGHNATEENDFGKLREKVKALEEREPPVSLEKFTEQGDEVKMYIKRLRKAEDTFKALAGGAKISDILDRPMEERIDGQETPQSQPNGRVFIPRLTTTPKTVPMGPALGSYQPVQVNGKGPAENCTPSGSKSNHTAMQARQRSQTPSGPSSGHPSPYSGKSAEPRQVLHLKGKRRVSSVIDSDDERNTTESSSVIDYSPAPSSSGPSYFASGSNRKDKKRAKKRAEQAEDLFYSSSRPGKKRKRNKQNE